MYQNFYQNESMHRPKVSFEHTFIVDLALQKDSVILQISNIIFLWLFLDKRHRRAEMTFLIVAVVGVP